jgi:photosystem II stability/assembly factor-like uncharacterized protein
MGRGVLVVAVMCVLCAMHAGAQTQVLDGQREGARQKKAAELYYESLHVVPPGMNWRVINDAVREVRAERRAKTAEAAQRVETVQGTWRELGSSNQAGRVVAVEYDAATGRVWVAGAGGTVWSGDTTGAAWTCHTDARRIENPRLMRLVKRANGTEFLVVVSSAARVWMLDLASQTWTQATGLAEMQRWGWFDNATSCMRDGRMEMHAVGTEWDYALWKGRRVWYRSVDSAKSFQRMAWIDGDAHVWSDGAQHVWLYYADTLASVAPDASRTTIKVSPFAGLVSTGRVMLSGPSATNIMAACPRGDSTIMLHSTNGGTTWTRRKALGFGPFDTQSFGYAYGANQWLFGGVDTYRTGDDARSWTRINGWGEYYADPRNKLHADIPAIVGYPNGVTFICTDGGLYISRNGGVTVRNISLRGLNISQYYSSYTSRDNADVVSAGSQDQGYQRSRIDSGDVRAFQQMISGDYSSLSSGDGGASLFMVYPGFTMYIPNHEDGWEPIGLNFPHRNHNWLPPLTVPSSRPTEAWLGGGTRSEKGAYIYRYRAVSGQLQIDSLSHDFGEGETDVRITALSFAPSNDRVCYVVTSKAIVWRTTDRGATWTKLARPDKLDGHYFSGNALCVSQLNPSQIVIGGSGYDGPGVYISNDAGATFTPLTGLPKCLVMSLAMSEDGRYIAAGTDVGAYVYDVKSATWTDITTGEAPDQIYWHVDRVEPLDIFRFSSHGRGIWDYRITGVVSVDDDALQRARNARIDARGIITQGASMVQITSAVEQRATITWYDLAGRMHAQQRIHLTIGTTSIIRPRTHATVGVLTAVVTTDNGDVAGCVVP